MVAKLKSSTLSAVERAHAIARARNELPLFLAVMGLLLVLWAGVLFAFGCRSCDAHHGAANAFTAPAPTFATCENQNSRLPGELLRCVVSPARESRAANI